MFNRLGKVHVFDFLNEGQGGAACLTTKAIKHSLSRRYGERGRLLAVEGTSANEIGTCALERHITANELFDVCSVKNLLYEIFGESHALASLLAFFVNSFCIYINKIRKKKKIYFFSLRIFCNLFEFI
jgi:hypothetical protein